MNDDLRDLRSLATDCGNTRVFSAYIGGFVRLGQGVHLSSRHEVMRAPLYGKRGRGEDSALVGARSKDRDRREPIDPDKVFTIPANYRMWQPEGKK
jgi:hypothetical protein